MNIVFSFVLRNGSDAISIVPLITRRLRSTSGFRVIRQLISPVASSPVSSASPSSLFSFSVSPLLVFSTTVDSLEESPVTVPPVEATWTSLAMACEIGGMTSDSTRLNTEAPHKTPASTRRVALLLCLDLSEFAFIDVSSPRDRDLALSLSNVSAQSVIAHA